jgi:hypothetical protein
LAKRIIAHSLSKVGWSRGCVALKRRTISIVDAHREDRKRFVVDADEKRTALLELKAASRVATASAEALLSDAASVSVHIFPCMASK